jgi:hypothetical protein
MIMSSQSTKRTGGVMDIPYRLYRAFHLGARTMLALDGKQITTDQVRKLQKLLREIAAGDSTLHDPAAEARANPVISGFIAQASSLPIQLDKELAGEILEYWK